VYYRGLIEFSNRCALDCLYCGIRRSNGAISRYSLRREEIVAAAKWCAQNGYGSLVLQSGERTDPGFIDDVVWCVEQIKQHTQSDALPRGLGITLCVGEQSEETYRRFFNAGAHRYLLRIETTDPQLFAAIHPPAQQLQTRLAALQTLQDIGFQVGTGVMIGIPGQTLAMLAQDLLFFKSFDIDMIGMGPWLPHEQTPLARSQARPQWNNDARVLLSLHMIALARLLLRDVNIAATTALQALDPVGREKGLAAGANVIMPQLTPTNYRKDYLLYENKPCIDEDKADCKGCLQRRIEMVGRQIAIDEWGDSRHFFTRTTHN
jgi:biotin synthase